MGRFLFISVILKQIDPCLQSATGMFHKKTPHVTTVSALPIRKALIPEHCTSAASLPVSAAVLSTAQLQPTGSEGTCFGWPQIDLDTKHERETCRRKNSEWSYQWQLEVVFTCQQKWKNSQKWLWETALQINSTLPQGSPTFEVQRWLCSASTAEYCWSKSHVVLEATWCLFFTSWRPEDQGHAHLHPGDGITNSLLNTELPTHHMCHTRFELS